MDSTHIISVTSRLYHTKGNIEHTSHNTNRQTCHDCFWFNLKKLGKKKDNEEKPITEHSIIPPLKLITPLKSEIKNKARQRKKENINQAYNRSPHHVLQKYLNRPKAIHHSNKVQFNGFLNRRPMSAIVCFSSRVH